MAWLKYIVRVDGWRNVFRHNVKVFAEMLRELYWRINILLEVVCLDHHITHKWGRRKFLRLPSHSEIPKEKGKIL